MTWWVVLDDRVGRSGLQDGTFGMTWSIVKDDVEHSETQGFGLGPKFPLSQSLHANHSGGEMPLGRMDWSRTDFWLAVGTGKNRSSTTTSPCTPYPLPSELQGDRVGKDNERQSSTESSSRYAHRPQQRHLAPASFDYTLTSPFRL